MSFASAMRSNAALLGVFAALTTALIAGVYLLTRSDIAAAQRAAEARQLREIFPDSSHDTILIDDSWLIPADNAQLGLREPRSAYRVRDRGVITGVILPATARDGYSGDIRLVVGIRDDLSIAGVRVVAHRETPGLGDAIDLRKSGWILGFNDRSLDDPVATGWTVRKDGGEFDQFTGATVTPRAVVAATRRALEYATAHRDTLFAPVAPAEDS